MNDRDIEDTRMPENITWRVDCLVCTKVFSNEDVYHVHDDKWICKSCSSKALKSLEVDCFFCGGFTVESLYKIDDKIIPICWACEGELGN